MAITINGSGTITGISQGGLPDGSITNDDLATGISAGKLTGTLPGIDGSALTGISAGAVHQVVYSKTSTTTSLSATSYTDIPNASVTITPTSSSNNIIIISNCQIEGGGSNSQATTGFYIHNSTQDRDVSGEGGFQETYDFAYLRKSTIHIGKDSPASTSAQTYKLRYKRYSGHGTMQAGGNGRGIVMLAIEVTP